VKAKILGIIMFQVGSVNFSQSWFTVHNKITESIQKNHATFVLWLVYNCVWNEHECLVLCFNFPSEKSELVFG